MTNQTEIERKENVSRTVEIGINEVGFSFNSDAKTILATYGMDTCVAVSGLERSLGIGFTAHYPVGIDSIVARGQIYYHLLRLLQGSSAEFEIQLKGGNKHFTESVAFHEELKNIFSQNVRTDITFNISSAQYAPGFMRNSALGVDLVRKEFLQNYTAQPDNQDIYTGFNRFELGLITPYIRYFPRLE